MSCQAPATRAASPGPSAGFTLLELLVVIGIISTLLGIGLGYIGRTDPQMVANAILAGEKRAAQMTARAEGVPTEVWVRPGVDGMPGTVQARLLEPVCSFHFEPGTPVLDERLRPQLGGEDVPAGRFGHARRPLADDRQPLLRWPVSPLVADVRDGFVLRLDLFFDRREAGVVVDMPPLLELRLDEDLRPTARLRLRGPGGETVRARVDSQLAMPLRRWSTLEVGCDGNTVWLAVDGRDYGRAAAEGTPHQEPDMEFMLSPPTAPLPGIVDEVRWLVFTFAPAQSLPPELQPVRPFRFAWDARGEPSAQPVIEYEALGDGS